MKFVLLIRTSVLLLPSISEKSVKFSLVVLINTNKLKFDIFIELWLNINMIDLTFLKTIDLMTYLYLIPGIFLTG